MSKILVIDDDEAIRANLADMLEAEGHEVLSADDGSPGVQLARQHLPDLIICDIMMPDLDGYGVLDELRRDEATATIPFIFLTARADKADVRQGMNLGADDYLVKPFTYNELRQAVSTRLAKQAALTHKTQSELADLRASIALALPHEMRTPLTGILGYAYLLGESFDSITPPEIQRMAEGIRRSAERLHEMLLNYVLYTELEIAIRDPAYARALMEYRACPVRPAVPDAALCQARLAQREADLTVELEESTLSMAEVYVAKLVSELASNACKFSLPGTPIQITGTRQGAAYRLSIRNHGQGMTAQQIASVGAFLQFERARREQQGTGLGLAIVHRLAELHGGGMEIESVYGQQITVHVLLPLVEG